MIENFNSADSENIKSNNKIKESESIQNLFQKEKYIAIIYFEKLNDRISLSFLYLTSVYIENIYKNSSHSILKKFQKKINFNLKELHDKEFPKKNNN